MGATSQPPAKKGTLIAEESVSDSDSDFMVIKPKPKLSKIEEKPVHEI